jgi:hypothetical protein
MRLRLVLPLLIAFVASGPVALAAEPSVGDCLAAAESALKLRGEHKLRKAREQLLVCGAPSCPAMVRADCTRGVDDVNQLLPSIAFSVRMGDGQELASVRVTMDGEVLAERLDGSALVVDPGSHEFSFVAPGQPAVTRNLLVHEGEKARRESVMVGAPVATTAPVAASTPGSAAAAPPPAALPADVASSDHAATLAANDAGSGRRTLGLVVGGTGVAGLAVGSIFGIVAISKNNSAGCDANSFCTNPQSRTDAQGAATISTVGFIAGGVLAAGGVVMIVAAPKHKGAATVGQWEAAPMVGGGTGGMMLRGSW